MMYVIVDSEKEGRTTLVKCNSKDELRQHLKLNDTQEIIGTFTDNEIATLNICHFAVVTG